MADGERAVELRPTWGKAHSRKALALHKLQRLDEALAAYQAGLAVEPDNAALQSGVRELEPMMTQMREMSIALQTLWTSMDWWAALEAK